MFFFFLQNTARQCFSNAHKNKHAVTFQPHHQIKKTTTSFKLAPNHMPAYFAAFVAFTAFTAKVHPSAFCHAPRTLALHGTSRKDIVHILAINFKCFSARQSVTDDPGWSPFYTLAYGTVRCSRFTSKNAPPVWWFYIQFQFPSFTTRSNRSDRKSTIACGLTD